MAAKPLLLIQGHNIQHRQSKMGSGAAPPPPAPAHLPAAADHSPLGDREPEGPAKAASLGPPRACSLEAAATLATLLPLPGEPQDGQQPAAAAPRQRSPRGGGRGGRGGGRGIAQQTQQQQQQPAFNPQQRSPAGPPPAAKRARTAAAAVPPTPAQQVPLPIAASPPQPAQPLLLPLPFNLLPAQQVPPLPGWQAALLASLGQAAQALAPRPPSIVPPSSPLAGRDAAAQLFHGGHGSSSFEQMLHALGGSGSSTGNLSAGLLGGSGSLSPRGLGSGGTAAGQGGGAADGGKNAAHPTWAAPSGGLPAASPPMLLSATNALGQPAGGSDELGGAAVQPGTPPGGADELQHQLLALLHSMAPSPSQLAQGQQQVVVQQLPPLPRQQTQAPLTPHISPQPKTAEAPLPQLILPSLPPLAAPTAAAAAAPAGTAPSPLRAPTPPPPVSSMAAALAAASAAAVASAAGAAGGLPSPRSAFTQALLGALPALRTAGDGKVEPAGVAAAAGTAAAAGPAAGPAALLSPAQRQAAFEHAGGMGWDGLGLYFCPASHYACVDVQHVACRCCAAGAAILLPIHWQWLVTAPPSCLACLPVLCSGGGHPHAAGPAAAGGAAGAGTAGPRAATGHPAAVGAGEHYVPLIGLFASHTAAQ